MMAPNVFAVDQARKDIVHAMDRAVDGLTAALALASDIEDENLRSLIRVITAHISLAEIHSLARSIEEGLL